MAKLELVGFDEYIRKIEALEGSTVAVCKASVYPGAAILADQLRASVGALPTISDAQALGNYRKGDPNPCLSKSQKAGLAASLGITSISRQKGGKIQASVGFSGYNSVRTKHFPKGQPNAEVARSLEKGASNLIQDNFVYRTVKAAKPAILEAMEKECNAQIEKLMEKTN